jgi:hypothetical protein
VEYRDLPPIQGDFPRRDERDVREVAPHEGFDLAWEHALEQAVERWHKPGEPPVEIPVSVEYRARVDIWNPGGIGHYSVIITPGGP